MPDNSFYILVKNYQKQEVIPAFVIYVNMYIISFWRLKSIPSCKTVIKQCISAGVSVLLKKEYSMMFKILKYGNDCW